MAKEGERSGFIPSVIKLWPAGRSKTKKQPARQEKKKIFTKWSFIISIWTFIIAVGISSISDLLLRQSSLLLGMMTLIVIVIIGAVTDMVGVAITAVDITPFNSMAAKKVYGARKCIHIIRHADRYANFFNDVIGDVAGYIAGFAGASIVIQIVMLSDQLTTYEYVISILVAGITSSAIVGSKAVGKNLALTYRTDIVLFLGKLLTMVEQIGDFFYRTLTSKRKFR